jgi:hypothetical protein
MTNTSFLLRDIERSPLFLVLQTPSKSLGISITKGDWSCIVVSEKHVRNFSVFLLEKRCFFIHVNLNGLRANRYE